MRLFKYFIVLVLFWSIPAFGMDNAPILLANLDIPNNYYARGAYYRGASTVSSWYDDWGRKVEITINKAICTTGTLTNFPILLYVDGDTPLYAGIPSEAIDAGSNSAQNGGGDLRFYDNMTTDYSAGGTNPTTENTDRLNAEIVNYVANATEATREAEVWVMVPTVNCNDQASSSTIVMYYNATGKSQPAIDASYGAESVWRSEYKGVYHMSDLLDSTSNDNDLTANGTISLSSSCKIGDCYDFESGNSEWMSVDTTDITAESFDINGWLKPDNNTDDMVLGSIADQSETGMVHWVYYDGNSTDTIIASSWDGSGGNASTSNSISDTNWHHINGRYIATNNRYSYLDMDTGNDGHNTTSISVSGEDRFGIGALADSTPSSYANGFIDEVRFIGDDLGVEWNLAEYNGTNDPNTYQVEGSPSGL